MAGNERKIKTHKKINFVIFLFSGIFALLCIPLILLGERGLIPLGDEHFRFPQFVAVFICLVSGVIYLIRRPKEYRFKRIVVIVGIFLSGIWLLIVICMISWLFLMPVYENYKHSIPFDAEQWKTATDTDSSTWPTRLCMVDDLIRSKKLKGLSRDETIAMLGEPFARWDGKRAGVTAGPNDIYYHLGPERGFISIDSEWLVIEFNDKNRVKKYWIYTD